MTEDKKYNGWSNYATWRVNLEIWDGYDWSDSRNTFSDNYDLSEYLKEQTDEILTSYGEKTDGLCLDYARAFVDYVDFREIAESVIENNPEIMKDYIEPDAE